MELGTVVRYSLLMGICTVTLGSQCLNPDPEELTERGPRRSGVPPAVTYSFRVSNAIYAESNSPSPAVNQSRILSLQRDLQTYAYHSWFTVREIPYNGAQQYEGVRPSCGINVSVNHPQNANLDGAFGPIDPNNLIVFTDTSQYVLGNEAGTHFTHQNTKIMIGYNSLFRPGMVYWRRIYKFKTRDGLPWEIQGAAAPIHFGQTDAEAEGLMFFSVHWGQFDVYTSQYFKKHMLAHEMLHLVARLVHGMPIGGLLGDERSDQDYWPFMGLHLQAQSWNALSWDGNEVQPRVEPKQWNVDILAPIKVETASGPRSQCAEMRQDLHNYLY